MNKKRLLSAILSLSLTIASIVPAFAIDYVYPVDEAGNSKETIVYDEASDEDTSVYAQIGSSFKVMIPKIIVLSGKTKTADYKVGVKGDIGGSQYIQIVTEPTFWLFDVTGVKDPEKGVNTRPASIFVSSNQETVPEGAINGINNDTFVESTGKLECSTITAGRWHSQVDFYIGLFDDFTNIVDVAPDGTMLELEAPNLYIGEEFQGLKATNVVVQEALTDALMNDANVANTLNTALNSNLSATRSLNIRSLTSNLEAVEEENTIKTLEQALENAKKIQANKEVVYESDNERVRVNSAGKIYLDGAVAGDKATITATYKGVFDSQIPGINDRDDIKVAVDVTVYRIDLSKDEVYLDLGDQTSITASLYPSYVEEDIVWNAPEMMPGVSFASSDNVISHETTMSISVAENALDDNNGELVAAVRDEYDNSARIVINAQHVHQYRIAAQEAPKCTEQGYTTYVCDGCDENTEGHTYTDYEPAVGHVCSDNHWCDRCDQLIYPYKYKERITKRVAGQDLEFICVDPEYTTENGQTGAYFLSTSVIPKLMYNTAGTSYWATASVRTVLNTDSDTTHVSLVDTTVKKVPVEFTDDVPDKYLSKSAYNWKDIPVSDQIHSEDYYFVPSLEELCDHCWWTWDPYEGDSSKNKRWGEMEPEPIYVYWTRTPRWNSKVNSYHTGKLGFVYTDAFITCTTDGTNYWFPADLMREGKGGTRVACMVFQNTDEVVTNNDWKCDDVVYRNINNEEVKFVCAKEHYIDADGVDQGALFISTKVFDSQNTIFDNETNVWSTSDLREYMNSWDTEGLVQVNTTTNSSLLKEDTYCEDPWVFYWEDAPYNWDENMWYNVGIRHTVNPETKDYYFILSAEEAKELARFNRSSTGQRRDLQEQWSQYAYGVALRNPVYNDLEHIGYISIDSRLHTLFTDKKCYSNSVGFRPCFVLPHKN